MEDQGDEDEGGSNSLLAAGGHLNSGRESVPHGDSSREMCHATTTHLPLPCHPTKQPFHGTVLHSGQHHREPSGMIDMTPAMV